MGERFSANLLRHLGVTEPPGHAVLSGRLPRDPSGER
jgi:hypothetical protein